MSNTIISVRNLSKSFTLKHQQSLNNYPTLRDVMVRKTKALLGRRPTVDPHTEVFWALDNVSFDIRQGDRVAIVGRNGSGKSTLLKILSRIMAPTKGEATIEGRVASLLEVGTGFHPELTGRENIFLSGAIHGMSKTDIITKFDEIVEFSGMERFLDTQVKRYSSGMYVRLGFAVTAHLEPDILILDEVLAVGDAEFQKKCLGKIQDVSKSGRTILFVSHNMATVQNLCSHGLYLQNGAIRKYGGIMDVTSEYMENTRVGNERLADITARRGNGLMRFTNGEVGGIDNHIESFKGMEIILDYQLDKQTRILQHRVEVAICNQHGTQIAWMSTDMVKGVYDLAAGKIRFVIGNLPLAPGEYHCHLFAHINNEIADWLTQVLPFTVVERDYYGTGGMVPQSKGSVLLDYTIL